MKRWIAVALCSLFWGSSAFTAVAAAVATQTCVGTITASTPTADFVDHGNGTVTHTKTGLMWKQCSEGLSGAGCATGTAIKYTWQGALLAAQTLNAAGGFAGFTDWRVPNIKELASIVETQCLTPSVNTTIFPNTISAMYWSASPVSYSPIEAWLLDFFDGQNTRINKNGNAGTYYVRLVRGGH